ncbi:MAG: hypothetical protein ACOX1Z_00290 [Candidatus Ratteibacteria bacterium]
MPKYFILKEKITVSDKHKAGEILNTLEKTLKEKEQMNTEDGIKIIRADGWDSHKTIGDRTCYTCLCGS